MQILRQIDLLLVQLGMSQQLADTLDQFIALIIVLIIAYTGDSICKHIILKNVARLVKKTKARWDDIIFDNKVTTRMSRMVAPIIIYTMAPYVFADSSSATVDFLLRLCLIYIIFSFVFFVHTLLNALYNYYSCLERFRDRPLKGLLQIVLVILWFVSTIIMVSVLIDKSPLSLLAGLGASAAVLMLVFKDSIMGFVSGVQLSANNMLKVGDWITMPKFGADGPVIEVTLNTVKVQNFDKTIITIPPYLLVSDSFQNWRGMKEAGGRRIKRSICIDMTSVTFCTPEMLERYRHIRLLKDYIEQTEEAVTSYNAAHGIDNSILVNGRRQTNLGVFRAYLTAYLRSLPTVRQDLTLMVRQLQPTDRGLPLELYFFSNNTDWNVYEGIQADVFDHVLAIIPEFGLRVFQSPSGADFRRGGNDSGKEGDTEGGDSIFTD